MVGVTPTQRSSAGGILGMTEAQAVEWKEEVRAMILEGAKNIDAGARP